jgi:hypothetical protein
LVFSGRKRNRLAIHIVVGFAFALFALSAIECTPDRLLLLLTNDPSDEDRRVKLPAAYSAVLTGLCLCLLVVFPAVVGVHLVPAQKRVDPDAPGRRTTLGPDQHNYRTYRSPHRFVNLLAALINVGYAVLSLVARLSLLGWRLVSRRRVGRTTSLSSAAVALPLTNPLTPQEHHEQLKRTKRVRFLSGKAFGAMALVVVWWTVLRSLAPLVVQVPSASSSTTALHTEHFYSASRMLLAVAVSWLCAIGLLLSSIVNGFGSVSFPWNSLTPLYLKPVTKESLTLAESELDRLYAALEERRYNLISLSSASSLAAPSGSAPASSSGTAGRRRNSSFSDFGEDLIHRRAHLLSEISFLESLVADTKEDVEEMRHSRNLSVRARTPAGRVLSWLGAVMSIVLILRLLTIAVGLSRWSQLRIGVDGLPEDPEATAVARTDVVTATLLWMMGHTSLVSSQQHLNQLSQFISLVLSSFLSVSQIRTFLRTASSVSRRLSNACGGTTCACSHHAKSDRRDSQTSTSQLHPKQLVLSTVWSYILATLGGCYFLACVVLTKLMLPPQYRRSFNQALLGAAGLGPKDPHPELVLWVRSYALDLVFILTAVLSAAILGVLFGIQRQNTHRYSSWATIEAASTTNGTGVAASGLASGGAPP